MCVKGMRGDSNRSLMGEAECHRLSTGSSAGSHDTHSISSTERSEDRRPVSLVSSVSSCSSVETISSPQRPSPSSGDIDLELSPSERPLDHSELEWTTSEPVITSSEHCKDPPSPFAASTMAPNPKLSYVDRVVMEIIETERMYVRDLRSIVEDYLVHVIDTRDLPIKPEQVCSLFGNIEQIYEFNSELLHCLDTCANDPVAIARCFVDKSEYFEIYTQYCTNYPNSVAVLTDCLRNKTLAKFLRDRQASLKRSLPLGSYLLKPVQRILKYHLLLQEIAKHFDPDEDGYDVVIEAIDTMTGVAWYINDMKRKHEHAVRVQEIQSLLINWKGPDLTTYGELVLEGTFHVHRAKNERTLFLFDKMMLITKKRGEHYVYKTHISCSTLMLIESAKDSLRFSVTHYKHPKQPHTVQARTVEEKKLWAHHIKRLILENHHAIIPQKARDAILDMDPTCMVKHRYSPDKMKKMSSRRSDDFSSGALQERRRSEPGKQITRSSKGSLKHADSESALLLEKDRRSLPPNALRSTPELMSVVPELMRIDHDLESSTGSLDDAEERIHEEEPQNADDDDGIEGEEEVLMEDEQVVDFTSSVLAALSCLRYRAKALLSHPITTDTDGRCVSQENRPTDNSHQTSLEGKSEQILDSLSVPKLANSCKSAEYSSSEEHRSSQKIPEDRIYPETCRTVDLRCTTDLEIDNLCNGGQEVEEDLENGVHFLSTQEDEMKEMTPSNRHLLEDIEMDITAHDSLQPSSVLDQTGDISQQLTDRVSRRSSLEADGSCELDPSSRSESRRSSLLSCSTETPDKDFRRSTPEPVKETPFKPDQRKPETLSKKDRLLIRKIKRYYEHAEHHDASFAIKRRESLSYIPAGLVRNLSQQLNDRTSDEDSALRKKVTRPTSWDVFNLPGLDSETSKVCSSDSKTQTEDEIFRKDEEFQPASDMVEVWQEMEVKTLGEPQDSLESIENSIMASPDQEKNAEISKTSSDSGLGEPLLILEESDETSTPSQNNSSLEKDNSHEFQIQQEHHKINHSPLPRIISLKSANEHDLILQDMEKMKKKVFHLARQYSQRIKNNRPVVKQRPKISENLFIPNNLSSVMEEKPLGKEKGFPDRCLSLNLNEQDLMQDSKTSSSSSSLCSPGSPYLCRLNIQRSQSPVQSESFIWPDVKELCSKYNNQDQKITVSHLLPVGRSISCPEPERSKASRSSSPCSFTMHRPANTDSTSTSSNMNLCKVNSFETQHTFGQQDSCYHTAHQTSPTENFIVVEKICLVKQEETGMENEREDDGESRLRWKQCERAMINTKEQDLMFALDPPCSLKETEIGQLSLVKNLREKIQSSYT
nr:pleckstrin homology domain-containing family G member 3 isoform X1 [Misgurnus anguillicaudatus]